MKEKIIMLEEVQEFNPEEYVYVDIRGKTAYMHGHIPGAVCWNIKDVADILPQVGTEGQLKLKNAKILVVGAGGLGAPAALYLAVAGIIGSIQALEAVKYILGTGELLVGKMLIFDGLTMKIRIINFGKKNESCKVCGNRKQISSIKDNAKEYMRNLCSVMSIQTDSLKIG